MRTSKEKVGTVLAVIAGIAVMLTIAVTSYDRSMVVHCTSLKAQAEKYTHFFVSTIDSEECSKQYNITINSPVR
jgi:hypothetical protein